MLIQMWAFSRKFLENDWSESITLSKTADGICCQWEHLSLQVKMRSLENLPQQLDRFLKLKHFSYYISGGFNDCELLLLYSEMCQHLEGLHNLVTMFPDYCMEWCYKLCVGIKTFQKCKSEQWILRFQIAINLKETVTEFWCGIRDEYSQLSENAAKIPFFSSSISVWSWIFSYTSI